ncbi:MAG: hypothetical protein ACW97X_00770 [Candidatus Hodarchaeales archaeon]
MTKSSSEVDTTALDDVGMALDVGVLLYPVDITRIKRNTIILFRQMVIQPDKLLEDVQIHIKR